MSLSKTRQLSRDRAGHGYGRMERYGPVRLWAYAPPWGIWLALPVVAQLFRAFATASQAAGIVVGALSGVVVVGLSAFTWHVFGPRGASVRVHATASIAAAGVWLMWVIVVGLFRHPTWHWFHPVDWFVSLFNGWPWGAWFLLGPAAAITWNLRRGARGDGTDAHPQGADLLEKVGIAGQVKRTAIEAGGTRVRARVAVEPGEQTADVQAARGRIASLVKTRGTGVRVIPDPDNHAEADVVIVPRDQLANPTPWPGPLAPGESIAVEIPVGVYEDAETARLWLPGDPSARPSPRNAAHYGVMGASGSGKSEGTLHVVTEVITRRDASVVYSDPVKGIQTVAPIAAGIDLLLTDQQTAIAAYRRLPTVIAHRTHRLGQYGFKQWTPAAAKPPCGLKYLIYVWEEAAALLANSSMFVAITEQARSAGLTLVPSMQRMSHDRLDTSARYNLGGGWCFGTGDDISAKFALSESTLDAGAAPWEWRDRKPGYSYLEAPGISEDRWPIPLRTYLADPEHQREVVAEYADPGLDETTAAAFGQVYADYRRQVAESAAAWQTAPGRTVIPLHAPAPVAGFRVDDPDGMQETDMDGFDVDGDLAGEVDDPDFEFPPNPESGFFEDIDAAKEIAANDDENVIRLPDPPARDAGLSPTAARAALRTFLLDMARAGHDTVEPRQLVEFRQRIGRQKSWLSDELRRLVGEGFLTDEPDRGVYGLPDPDEPGSVPA
jgi:hypothetical protein